jgi:branched-chain amino acid transport system substrate-binding protein
MLSHSRVLAKMAVMAVVLLGWHSAEAKDSPGVTATEIKIGQTMPYSGPASSYASIGKGEAAYFKMVNEKGGIKGRQINLLSVDDGYTPAKTVEQIRKLVESDGVAFIFNSLGTASNSAIQKYLNQKKVPQLFVASGADKWADPEHFPWTMGWQPSYRIEARIYARYIQTQNPAAKVCVLYQNDDFGKDYLIGLKDVLKDKYATTVIKEASYEVTDPTVDSQVATLQAAGCDTLITATTPKFAAQAIRKVADIGWKPLHFMSNVSLSVTSVLTPAGPEKAVGMISGAYLKDPSDPEFQNDPSMVEYRDFMKKYMPESDPKDVNFVYAYSASRTLVQVLTQCGDNLSRENIMKQAASLKSLKLPLAVPGTEVNTGPNDFRPFSQMQLAKWTGKSFERFGTVLNGD